MRLGSPRSTPQCCRRSNASPGRSSTGARSASSHRHRDGVARIQQQLVPLNASFGLHLELPDYVAAPVRCSPASPTTRSACAGSRALQATSTRWSRGSRKASRAGYLQPQVIVRQVAAQSRAMLELPAAQKPLLACLARLPPSFDARPARGSSPPIAVIRSSARCRIGNFVGVRFVLVAVYKP